MVYACLHKMPGRIVLVGASVCVLSLQRTQEEDGLRVEVLQVRRALMRASCAWPERTPASQVCCIEPNISVIDQIVCGTLYCEGT